MKLTQAELAAPAYEPFRRKAKELAEAAGRGSMAEVREAIIARKHSKADRDAIKAFRDFCLQHPAFSGEVVFAVCGLPEAHWFEQANKFDYNE